MHSLCRPEEQKEVAVKKPANANVFHQKVNMAQLVASDRRKIISNPESLATNPISSPVANPTASPEMPTQQKGPPSATDRSRSTLGHMTRKLKRPQTHHQ